MGKKEDKQSFAYPHVVPNLSYKVIMNTVSDFKLQKTAKAL